MRESQREYWESVKSIATEAFKLPEDERSDFVHESVDGSEWIIYTHSALMVLVHSPHHTAYWQETGEPLSNEGAGAWCVAAYYAMLQDVYDTVSDLDGASHAKA